MTAATMGPAVDHVTVAGEALDRLERAFAEIGLAPVYGGAHSTGGTQMALVGFDDGSYIELIAAQTPGSASGKWAAQIAGNGGPCAWCARTSDIAAEAARVAALGVPVRGPVAMSRRRPDGTQVEWELLYPGDQEPGATLPFVIQDRTPRELRVQPSPSVADRELRGVAQVILGVERIAPAVALFRRVYGLEAPEQREDAGFGARLARFVGTPVTLAEPLPGAAGDWLRERLAHFGPAPCAYLLASSDLDASARRMGLTLAPEASGESGEWFGQRAAWVAPERLGATRLGVVSAS
ncbi:MAG TPA: VOC family protein [Ktedonobacterales bacterium]|nr:VOC family protein [Ktedonobacterales bacterium]